MNDKEPAELTLVDLLLHKDPLIHQLMDRILNRLLELEEQASKPKRELQLQ